MIVYVVHGGEKKGFKSSGGNLLDFLRKNGYIINADCGGNLKCGKCKVTIIKNGKIDTVYSCHTEITDGITVLVESVDNFNLKIEKSDFSIDKESQFGIAVDVGSTTIVSYLLDLSSKKTIATCSFLNPQKSFGADVVSRIKYCMDNGISELKNTLISRLNEVFEKFKEIARSEKIERVAFTGNTVMLHTIKGEDISSFGQFPFTPKFLQKIEGRGIDFGLNCEKVILLPSFSSFVGADIVCGGIATEIERGNNLLIDLGTNGEMLLSYGGKIYATSVAAGPAFEGADIECGMGGISGAISSLNANNGQISYTTVDKKEAIGICGAGIVDAVAVMLDLGIIDGSGAFLTDEGKFFITDKVYISSKDIRKFQLAKSAVRSGIETLLEYCNISYDKVDKLYICGGLGYYINKQNAVKTGIIPKQLEEKVVNFGNGAGEGAKLCLCDNDKMEYSKTLATKAEIVELSSNPVFSEKFMEYMFFEDYD